MRVEHLRGAEEEGFIVHFSAQEFQLAATKGLDPKAISYLEHEIADPIVEIPAAHPSSQGNKK